MKITNSTQAPKPTAASGTSGSGRAGSASRQASAATASAASAPAAPLSQLDTQSDFNVGKVGQVSADIAAGRYQVDASAVADKLLASTAALGGKAGSAS